MINLLLNVFFFFLLGKLSIWKVLVLFKQIANGTIDWEVLKQILSKYLGIVKFFYIFILLSDFLFDFIKLCILLFYCLKLYF